MGVILRCKLPTHTKEMSKLSRVQFVPNILSYVSAKYLNWLTVGKVTTKK